MCKPRPINYSNLAHHLLFSGVPCAHKHCAAAQQQARTLRPATQRRQCAHITQIIMCRSLHIRNAQQSLNTSLLPLSRGWCCKLQELLPPHTSQSDPPRDRYIRHARQQVQIIQCRVKERPLQRNVPKEEQRRQQHSRPRSFCQCSATLHQLNITNHAFMASQPHQMH